MGSERVDSHFQEDEATGAESKESAPLSYNELFETLCPEYMAMGMTYDEYWNGDNLLPKYYRKAEEIKQRKKNHEFWLQGMYVYEAILDASPVYREFAKNARPLPYPTEPYPLSKKEKEEQQERKEKFEMEKIKASMSAWMKKIGGNNGG